MAVHDNAKLQGEVQHIAGSLAEDKQTISQIGGRLEAAIVEIADTQGVV